MKFDESSVSYRPDAEDGHFKDRNTKKEPDREKVAETETDRDRERHTYTHTTHTHNPSLFPFIKKD